MASPGQILIAPQLEELGLLTANGLAGPVKPLNVVMLRDRA